MRSVSRTLWSVISTPSPRSRRRATMSWISRTAIGSIPTHRAAAEHARLLRQVTDSHARPPVDRLEGDVGAVHRDAAARRAEKADDHVEGRGLARAVRPQEPDHLAAVHAQADLAHHRPLTVVAD